MDEFGLGRSEEWYEGKTETYLQDQITGADLAIRTQVSIGLVIGDLRSRLEIVVSHLSDVEKGLNDLKAPKKTEWSDIAFDMFFDFVAIKVISIGVKSSSKLFKKYIKKSVQKKIEASSGDTNDVLNTMYGNLFNKDQQAFDVFKEKFTNLLDQPEEVGGYGLAEELLGEIGDKLYKKTKNDVINHLSEKNQTSKFVKASLKEYDDVDNFLIVIGLKLDIARIMFVKRVNEETNKTVLIQELLPLLHAQNYINNNISEATEYFMTYIEGFINSVLFTGSMIHHEDILTYYDTNDKGSFTAMPGALCTKQVVPQRYDFLKDVVTKGFNVLAEKHREKLIKELKHKYYHMMSKGLNLPRGYKIDFRGGSNCAEKWFDVTPKQFGWYKLELKAVRIEKRVFTVFQQRYFFQYYDQHFYRYYILHMVIPEFEELAIQKSNNPDGDGLLGPVMGTLHPVHGLLWRKSFMPHKN